MTSQIPEPGNVQGGHSSLQVDWICLLSQTDRVVIMLSMEEFCKYEPNCFTLNYIYNILQYFIALELAFMK